jgi:hypothetical protein
MNCIELPLSPEMAVPILLSSPCRRGARAAFRRFSAQNETCGDAWEATTGMGHQADPMLGSGCQVIYIILYIIFYIPALPSSTIFIHVPNRHTKQIKTLFTEVGWQP